MEHYYIEKQKIGAVEVDFQIYTTLTVLLNDVFIITRMMVLFLIANLYKFYKTNTKYKKSIEKGKDKKRHINCMQEANSRHWLMTLWALGETYYYQGFKNI